MTARPDSASFRDPAGRVFVEDDRVIRRVDASYRLHYDAFHHAPVSRLLRDKGWLIDYREIDPPEGAYRALESEKVPFVSYPYEWSFSQLRDAALLTLDIQALLLEHGFVLKDATPFNVQFYGSRPVFIDLLSFEVLEEGAPWAAYRQFCEAFLAPLLLMAHVDLGLGSLLQSHLEGVPLRLCSQLLPLTAKIRPLTFLHVVLHGRLGASQEIAGDERRRERSIGKPALQSITRQLRSIVERLRPRDRTSLWSSYYDAHLNYTEEGFRHKRRVLEGVLDATRPRTVWDLGCNTGVFSEVCADHGAYVVAFDSDPLCVEKLFTSLRREGVESILPLCLDLANPSAGVGWANRERKTVLERGSADLTLALGLVHHLRLTHNVPFELQAELFARCGSRLLVELVPAEDEMTRKLARHKQGLLEGYTEEGFLDAFRRFFEVEDRVRVTGSARTLYLLQTV